MKVDSFPAFTDDVILENQDSSTNNPLYKIKKYGTKSKILIRCIDCTLNSILKYSKQISEKWDEIKDTD